MHSADSPSPHGFSVRPWRSLAGAFIAFGGVGLVFLFGARLVGLNGAGEVRQWLMVAAASPWTLPATVLIFAALAFVGTPQVVLIAAAVLALGPKAGMAYSWAGTLVSAAIGYGLGRRFGPALLRDWSGPRMGRFVDVVARNGFLTSLVVRLAPSAPFILVNMAAGVAGVGLIDFLAGTAIGIVPKIVLTGLAGRTLLHLGAGGDAREALTLIVAACAWIALSAAGYLWLKRREGVGRFLP
jgi:uncharacterized membrane protein YdjX (TVP38/TMEM64 family)